MKDKSRNELDGKLENLLLLGNKEKAIVADNDTTMLANDGKSFGRTQTIENEVNNGLQHAYTAVN